MTITIVGLGPGDASQITRQAWHLLSTADRVYLRTRRHPVVSQLPTSLEIHSFDDLYDTAGSFAEVYTRIAAELIHAAQETGILYAVPGDPATGEATVTALRAGAAAAGLPVHIVSGLSFVQPAAAMLGIDVLDGLQVMDAIAVADYLYPPISPDIPVVLGQVYNELLANSLKLALMSLYPVEHPVVLVHAAGTDAALVEHVPLYEMDRSSRIDHLTSLYVPSLPRRSSLNALAETVAVLRSPEGCPWDQEQTSQSLRDGFLEEAYEVLAAIDADDSINLGEELGDLLYHIVMQTQIAAEEGSFTLSDVIAGIEAKLRRRHPHVWGDVQVDSSAEVLRNWEELKKTEKHEREGSSLLDGIPGALPALARSQKIQTRAAAAGFDWPAIDGVYDKLAEEVGELQAARMPEELRLELGDTLFVLVNLARWLGVDSESALREANERFGRRFRRLEAIMGERSLAWPDLTFQEMDDLWREAKAALASEED